MIMILTAGQTGNINIMKMLTLDAIRLIQENAAAVWLRSTKTMLT